MYAGGITNMRFDDTNPEKEEIEYIKAILEDVTWLVNTDDSNQVPWHGEIKHASDYFELIYESALYLIKNDLAYVDNLSVGTYHSKRICVSDRCCIHFCKQYMILIMLYIF